MHHTDTVDFDIVLSGSIELILDDGAHPLAAGDSMVVTGVDHTWRAGPGRVPDEHHFDWCCSAALTGS